MGRITRRKTGANKRKTRIKGLRGRWMTHTVGPVLALAAVFVIIISASFAAYYYSNMQSDMQHRAKTTTEFFANYIGQSYNAYYQSCVTYARTFEEKNTIELQFINTSGRIVASSYGRWVGPSPTDARIFPAPWRPDSWRPIRARTRPTGERIMAVSSPMIYSSGEVIGVLRYVTSMKVVDRQLVFVTPGCPGRRERCWCWW